MKAPLLMLLSVVFLPLLKAGDTLSVEREVVVEIIGEKAAQPFQASRYQAAKRLSNALNEYSSVYIKNYGNGQLATLTVRGTSAAQTEVQWNGVRLNSPALGVCDLSLFALGTHDVVSLKRTGTNGTIGGTLNLISSTSVTNGFEALGQLRGGSFRTIEVNAGMLYGNGKFSGATRVNYIGSANNFSYRNSYMEGNPRVRQTNAQVQLLSLLQSVSAQINARNRIALHLWMNEAQREIPPVISKPQSREKQYDYSLRTMAEWHGNYGTLMLRATTAWLSDKLRYENPDAGLDETSLMQAWRNSFSAQCYFKTYWKLSAELQYDLERATVKAYRQTRHRSMLSLRMNTRYAKNGLEVQAGFRQDVAGNQPSAFAPQVEVGYKVHLRKNNALHFSVQAGRNFRFPTLNDLYWQPGGNPQLRQEKSWNGELSATLKTSRVLQWSITGFCVYVNDWIQWIPQNNLWTPQNFRTVLSRGVETSVELSNRQLTNQPVFIDIQLSYTFTRATHLQSISVHDNSKGHQLIYVPEHSSALGVHMEYRKFYLRCTANAVSRLFITTDNSAYLPRYFTANIEAGKDFVFGKQEAGLAFRVNNVADAQYENIAQRPMPGRGFEGVIRFKLIK